MKKMFALIIVLIMVLSLSGGVTAFAENQYLTNGDFETGSLAGWKTLPLPEGAVREVKTDAATGNHYLYMESISNDYVAVSQLYVGLSEKDLVTLSFDLKIDALGAGPMSSSGALIGGSFKDENGENFGPTFWYKYYENRGEWEHYEIDFLVPEKAAGLGIGLRLYGGETDGGKISWDNIKLTDAKNKTDLKVDYKGVELNRIPDGINSVTAKAHYVSETGNEESGNLIFAAYSKGASGQQELAGLSVVPFTTSATSDSVFVTSDIALPDDAKDISVKAYVWKNGSTIEPVADSEILPKEGRSEVFDRLVTEKMRGAYGAVSYMFDDNVMNRLLDAGINTIIYMDNDYGDGDIFKENLEKASAVALEKNLMVFTKTNYSSNRVVTNTAYGAYHPGRANELHGPCPLATGYWEKAMYEPLAIAAGYKGITGGIFDMEMYHTGGGGQYYEPCLCDTCVAHYASDYPSEAATGLVNTAADNRFEYTKQNSILTEYHTWQTEEITKIAVSMRERLHAINPDFIIGVMPYYNWFEGLDKGLGTERMPLVVFSEAYSAAYGRGWTEVALLEKDNLFGIYTRGIGPSESFVGIDEFKEVVTDRSMLGAGYFLYDIPALEKDFAAATADTATTYYKELKKANAELDTALGLD